MAVRLSGLRASHPLSTQDFFEVEVTLRLTVSLGVEPIQGLET
jgi:hypothetical protein